MIGSLSATAAFLDFLLMALTDFFENKFA